MRITAVQTFPIDLPLSVPVRMSHVTIERSSNVLVKVTTDEGIIGWGEGVEAIDVTGDSQERISGAIEALGTDLIGADPLLRTNLWLRMGRSEHTSTTAIGAIDIALHDIAGKALGVPITDLIGGATRTSIPALTLIGSGDPQTDLEAFQAKYEAGYRWFKVKVGIGDPATEADTMKVLSGASTDAVLCCDANGGWSEEVSKQFLHMMGGLSIRFVEQPTLDRAALVRLAAESPIAVCADESARSLDDLVALGGSAVAGVSLKLIKHGGITGVMRGAVLCDTLGLSINLAGKVAESSVAAAANLHCAAAMSDTTFGCSPANQGLAADVTANPVVAVDGCFAVPTGPGLGVEVDEQRVRSLSS
jgi:muconate cycloisomerase